RKKTPLTHLKKMQLAISNVEEQLGGLGRVLVRYSGTEEICRVMVEGPKQHQVDLLAQTLANAVEKEIGLKRKREAKV
ncbi:MAG TPA: hypothetical protein VEK06_01245, partial [Myxococcota bacterium]|nr:hypothetical protein [Myxococcota bacterium]